MAVDFYSDFFEATALTDAISQQEFVPGMLSGLFETRLLAGTKLAIEDMPFNPVEKLATTPRGTPSKAATLVRNKVHTFETGHYREDGAVYADEVLNMRASGVTAAREVIAARRNEVLSVLRRNIDFTHEALRMVTLNTPTNAFGTAPAKAVIAFGASDTGIDKKVFNVLKQGMETALNGVPYSGLTAYCSDTFWEGFIESKTIRDTYLNQIQAQQLRDDLSDSVTFRGVRWVRYRGNGTVAIEAGMAKVVPTGVPGMFIQAFAPADTLDTIGVGAMGTPYWVQGYQIDGGNRGWHIEAQTNCVMVCTRPTAVLTIGLA